MEVKMSIKKIAELTGVSTATVSRVLNNPNYKCSHPELRDEIWKAAIEINYVPNAAARNLKKGIHSFEQTSYHIDILMTRMDGIHKDPFFEELLRSVESQIHENNCVLSRIWYRSVFSDDRKCTLQKINETIQEMLESSNKKEQHGLVIIGKCNQEAIRKLKKHYTNIVSINRNTTNYEIDEVLCDGKKIASTAVEHLIRLSHKKIAYVGVCHNEARFQGFCSTLEQHNIPLCKDYIIETTQTEKEGYQTIQHFMKMKEPPTGIYCANDITAIGMLKGLRQFQGYSYTPSIISSDGIEAGETCTPMLSTVQLPKENMAKFAIYLLLDRIRNGHTEVVRMELEGQLMVRMS